MSSANNIEFTWRGVIPAPTSFLSESIILVNTNEDLTLLYGHYHPQLNINENQQGIKLLETLL